MKRVLFSLNVYRRLNGAFSLFQMENLDSAFTELTSHLEETSKDLAELNITIREVKSFRERYIF